MGASVCKCTTCVYVCGGQRRMSVVFLYLSPLLFRLGLLLTLKIPASENQASQGTSGVWPSLLTTALGIK